MRVIHLNFSDINGGAARAAYRIHHCLRVAGVDSTMWVNKATAGDWTVEGPTSKKEKLSVALHSQIGGQLPRVLKTGNPIIHSPAILSSQWVKRINESDADVVNLHWVQGEMLSIADIGRIKKPIVWTLHDMWAFCGAEHYTEDYRWRDGYTRNNRPSYESGFDLNRWVWGRKKRHWVRPMHIVTPSNWLADCVRQSELMRDWPVSVVHNPIDIDRWKPVDQRQARDLLGLPVDRPLLLFGAMGGGRDPRKGFDLLLSALRHLRDEPKVKGLELVVFGQIAPKSELDLGFPVHYVGHLHDDVTLKVLYSAADAMAISSRQDNLPNTGVEAQACGTPVVAFDVGGLSDIVEHERTGYLATPFDTEDLAKGIIEILSQKGSSCLESLARKRAVERFAGSLVAEQYRQVYASAVRDFR